MDWYTPYILILRIQLFLKGGSQVLYQLSYFRLRILCYRYLWFYRIREPVDDVCVLGTSIKSFLYVVPVKVKSCGAPCVSQRPRIIMSKSKPRKLLGSPSNFIGFYLGVLWLFLYCHMITVTLSVLLVPSIDYSTERITKQVKPLKRIELLTSCLQGRCSTKLS